jgi:transcriptional regulator with XRE-family HTH domain
MQITPAQIRGARGLLEWSQIDLATKADLSKSAVAEIETSKTMAREKTMQAIQHALESAGIEFLDSDGVRFRRQEVQIFKGVDGFTRFFDLVYDSVKDGGEILQCGFMEDDFITQSEDWAKSHIDRMQKIAGLDCRVLQAEGDSSFPCSYASYRWIPHKLPPTVQFYLFNRHLAFFLLDRNKDPFTLLLRLPALAEAFRVQFLGLWDVSVVPNKRVGD